ncbi:hypothetical protein NO2_1053 [Candidatus Termititenax persephonae]|uniref:Uncharacterized protein n=1 Tax=Candidatus Termititenax persephonae TaxID=2218525 RepID=A0A388THZ2_9BACT|nr:hypothetical protein NO2_1053 [Candidatus Termititenax persephonae]
MQKYFLAMVILAAGLLAMGDTPANGWSRDYTYARGDVFVVSEQHIAGVQDFDTEQTGLALYRLEMESLEREFRNHYNLRIYVQKVNPALQVQTIKYLIRFFDDGGQEYKSLVLEDAAPSFLGGVSSPTWFGNILYKKPYKIKVRVQSYVLKTGKEMFF